MATSDIILRRLREEQAQNQWKRSGQAWESTPTPTPTPTPKPKQQASPTPTPQRLNPYFPSAAQGMTIQDVGRQVAPTPTPRPQSTPKPITATPAPTMPPVSTQPVKPQLPYQTYIPDYRTAKPMSQMPEAKPMQGPMTRDQAMAQQESIDPRTGMRMRGNGGIGTVLERGGGFAPATTQRAPAMGAEDVLLQYLQQSGDPELLARLAERMQAEPWVEGRQEMNVSDGYAPGYQGIEYNTIGGRQRLLDVLSRYYAGQPTAPAPRSNSWGR